MQDGIDLKYQKEANNLMGIASNAGIKKNKLDKGLFNMNGRAVTQDELERVQNILKGLHKYVNQRNNPNKIIKDKRKDGKDDKNYEDDDEDNEDKKFINPLTEHMAHRQEITSFWNKFSMIEPDGQKNKKRNLGKHRGQENVINKGGVEKKQLN